MFTPPPLPAPYWQSGDSALYQGDCYPLVMGMPAGRFRAVVTDCPYCSGGMVRGDRALPPSAKYIMNGVKMQRPDFTGDTRDQRGFLVWATLWLGECLRVTQDGGYLMAFIDWRNLPVMTDAVQAAGWVWRGIVPWDKGEGVRPQRGWFRAQCEYVVTASKGPMGLEQEREVSVCAPGIFRHTRGAEDREHMNGKPVGLMRDLLQVVPRGARVLDTFAGGGATLVACRELGLPFDGIDYEAHNCAIAARRLDERLEGLG